MRTPLTRHASTTWTGATLAYGERKPTAFLTANQVYTVEVFQACAPIGTVLGRMKRDGGFGFESASNLDAQRTINCMAEYGFTFSDTAVGEPNNFGPR
jgi:hypothetical protein